MFRNKVFFAPTNKNGIDINKSRKIEFRTREELSKKKLISKSISIIIQQNKIDPYAIRNYWVLVGGLTEVTNKSCSDVDNLIQDIKDYKESISVTKGDNRIESVIIVSTDSQDSARKVKKKIRSDYSKKIPIRINDEFVHIKLRCTWTNRNSSIQDLNKLRV